MQSTRIERRLPKPHRLRHEANCPAPKREGDDAYHRLRFCGGTVSEDAFAEGVALGRRNNEAREYIRRHCRHARVEQPMGNSPVGRALGLTLGLLEIRCEHAPAPKQLGHDALNLAVDFYDAHCRGCAFRDSSGELPNLATIAEDRRREVEAHAAEAARHARERTARYHARLKRRRQLVAGESYLIRDLAEWLDRIDVDKPRERELDASERETARLLLETGRHAPDLFTRPLIDTLVDLATDSAEPSAFTVLAVLARAGRLPARTLIEAALAVLPEHPVAEAARVLHQFADQLQPPDLPPILDRLIALAAGRDDHWRPEPEISGLLAAADVDLPGITGHLATCLQSENAQRRADAAEAAGLLLAVDPNRIVALGPPLVDSVQGRDQGYWGTPSPTAEATRALAEAWRGAPVLTSTIIESCGRTRPPEARAELIRTIYFLRRWHEPLVASDEAVDAAVEFCLQRMGGDWGAEAADQATDELETLCREAVAHVVPHIDTLFGQLLELCAPRQQSPLLQSPEPGMRGQLAVLDHLADDVTQRRHHRTVARIIGLLAKASPTIVFDRVLPLFTADSGVADQDRLIRRLLLLALEEAVSPHALRDVLPVLYSALLSPDQVIRGDAIGLWKACARVAGPTMPDDFAHLAPVMLQDRYVIVHTALLRALPRLHLPDDTAPALLPLVTVWARAYDQKPDVLNDALWSLRYLIQRCGDEQTRQNHNRFALSLADRLSPYDRERFLFAEWPEQLRAHPVWSRAALHALASADMADIFDRRGDRLFAALLDQPGPLQTIPYEAFGAVADAYLPQMPWRAIEMVELLQAAGRWADATILATHVHERAAPGREGEIARSLAAAVLAHCQLSEAVTRQAPIVGDDRLPDLLQAVRTTTAALESAIMATEHGSPTHHLVSVSRAYADAIASLLVEATADPDQVAAVLDWAADAIETYGGQQRAAGRQRHWYSHGLRIAAALRRFDGAVRRADSDAQRYRDAAQRQAEVLSACLVEGDVPGLQALESFCGLLAAVSSARDVGPACVMLATMGLPCLLVHMQDVSPSPRPTPTTDTATEDTPIVVSVFSMRGVPITDVLVLRPTEVYHLAISVRLPEWPHWADQCDIQLLTSLDRSVLTVPLYTFRLEDAVMDAGGCLLTGEQSLHCAVQQPIRDPAIDCPLLVRFSGAGRVQHASVAGYRRLRLRPFDPSRDRLTDHEQVDARLLAMYETIADSQFDAEDVRAFCRIFSACVRATQSIMFDKVFRRGQRVTETQFHNELERRLRADSQLEGRLTRRDAVAGGLDDLLHDDVIVELKVARTKAVTVDDCARYLGQPVQYGVGRGSQLSVLVVLDHSNKTSPPGVLDNYVGWLKPRLHGLDDPRYPSLVGVLIVNTNLPLPSTWSRHAISTAPLP